VARVQKRHADKIVTKKGERFASCRADWTKKLNIAQMYDVIYDVMVKACIASKWPVSVYTDREGNEVEEGERFGLKQDIRINHDHYLIFGNKSECRTNQKKDGHVGGTTHVVKRGMVPQTVCSVNDHAFTILPFTSVSGGVVCCVVIFTSNNDDRVPILWKTGIDIEVIDPFCPRVEASLVKFLSKYWNTSTKLIYSHALHTVPSPCS